MPLRVRYRHAVEGTMIVPLCDEKQAEEFVLLSLPPGAEILSTEEFEPEYPNDVQAAAGGFTQIPLEH